MNAAGSGMVMPFLAIYLHNVRGIGLGTVGLVLAVFAAVAFFVTPAAGSAVDTLGARGTLVGSLLVSAAAYGLLPLVRTEWHAFALVGLAGVGNGAFWPSQGSLLAALAGRAGRGGAFSVQRALFNLGLGVGGLAGGVVAAGGHFTALFLADAATFLAYAAVAASLPAVAVDRDDEPTGGWRAVLRDRVFLGIVGLNAVYVIGGYTLWEIALPVYAKNEAGLSESTIGAVFFVNAAAIVLLQLPVAHALAGRSRMRALAAMTAVWALAWMAVLAAGVWLAAAAAAAAVGAAAFAFGLGECALGPAQSALVADMAPDRLRGRYISMLTTSAAVGYTAGPVAVGFLLAAAPHAVWPLAAGVLLVAGAGALLLERRVPSEHRTAPVAAPSGG